jgi:ATP-dependent helicase HepA
MTDFIRGQRWVSDTEAELGLGTVLTTDARRVTLLFPACNETRVYAKTGAPLSRVRFQIGDTITNQQGLTIKISQLIENKGIFEYLGTSENSQPLQSVPEAELSHFIQFSKPQDRLFAGQIDSNQWFELRQTTLNRSHTLAQSPVRGLFGSRISLILHQLYIAHDVASRYAPRVLLADEVGLGKTIEAGLIVHQQLLTERAQRVLLLIPESLTHQWLVEMRRRFNLNFSFFDEERCSQIQNDNPFHGEQLVLCSLKFLLENPLRQRQAIAGEWDLLVVDEAHHLYWDEGDVSPEYALVEKLSQHTKGLLLLTATPEQLGEAGHFARLRLLDPDRFYDYEKFIEEDKHYEPVAEAVQHLLTSNTLPEEATETLLKTLGETAHAEWIHQFNQSNSHEEKESLRRQLIDLLLDRHGTGRVLFRNTRAAIQGFPERHLHSYPLNFPDIYKLQAQQAEVLADILYPEIYYQKHKSKEDPLWWAFDPRVRWLANLLEELKPAKILVICAYPRTALDLEQALYAEGVQATVFHEGMSIIQRDRAAAFFADPENGARVLVCSEIGSEGRNFQFAHHLVLFDTPLNPDLLEQRIGRLDRIGQSETIDVHVPYMQGGVQEVLYYWYHEGLNAFEHTCPACAGAYEYLQDELLEVLATFPEENVEITLEDLITKAQKLLEKLRAHLQKGRDHLLEFNSFRPQIAQQLQQDIKAIDEDNSLVDYLEHISECFNFKFEEHSKNSFLIAPSDEMFVGFSELPEEGMTVTLDRETALSREDLHFLTWEHPFMRSAMDSVLSSEQGNATFIAIKSKKMSAGTLLLETSFIPICSAPKHLQPDRFFPPRILRLVLDIDFIDHSQNITPEKLRKAAISVDVHTARKVIRSQRDILQDLLEETQKQVAEKLPILVKESLATMRATLNEEIERLKDLKTVNPNVRPDEIDFLHQQREQLTEHLQAVQLRLDAVRVIVTT